MTRRQLFGLVGAAVVGPRVTVPTGSTPAWAAELIPLIRDMPRAVRSGAIRGKFQADFRGFMKAVSDAEVALLDLKNLPPRKICAGRDDTGPRPAIVMLRLRRGCPA